MTAALPIRLDRRVPRDLVYLVNGDRLVAVWTLVEPQPEPPPPDWHPTRSREIL